MTSLNLSPGVETRWLNSQHRMYDHSIYWRYNMQKDLYEIALHGWFGEGQGSIEWRSECEVYAEYIERSTDRDGYIWNVLDGLQEEGIQIAIKLLTGRDEVGYYRGAKVTIPEHLCTNWGP